MTDKEAIVAFNMIPSVGFMTVQKLVADFGGSVVDAYENYPTKLDWEGKPVNWEAEFEKAAKMNVTIVAYGDELYPKRLLDNASPPLVLYVVGNPEVMSNDGVALVGTRFCTPYGKEVATNIAFALARKGWTIYSGLARGIDGASHQGALDAKGCTVGVLGGAMDMFFPTENRELARNMVASGGAVVSEFPFGRHPDNMTFPRRNRIVAALSRGVVSIECPVKSGTLITCSRALEMGRSVMAVPGRVGDKNSAGCLKLIREGARLVTCAEDIIEEISPIGKKCIPQKKQEKKPTQEKMQHVKQVKKEVPPEVKITLEESIVLRELDDSPVSVDQVVRKTGMEVGKVTPILVSLRMKGKVKFLPGNKVSLQS